MASHASQDVSAVLESRKRRTELSIIRANFTRHRMAMAGLVILIILGLSAIFANVITVHDPYAQNLSLVGPGRPANPSLSNIWGTDQLGRDYFSRAMFGGRISLSVGFVAVSISIAIGVLMGGVAGYFGGRLDQFIMRFTDMVLAFPPLLILLALVSVFRNPNIFLIMVVIGILGWMIPARLIRAEFLALRETDYVMAAKVVGCSPWRIGFRHILRNSISPIIVAASLAIPQAILQESTLSFLGLGVPPPTPSWGNMLTLSLKFMREGAWWMGIYPGLLISIAVLSFNFVGDGLRDALDPRLRTR